MKTVNIFIILLLTCHISACMDPDPFRSVVGGAGDNSYLSNDDGLVLNCNGNLISTSNPPYTGADDFWEENNLPQGTADFACKDGTAYLPSEITDCDGRIIAQQVGGFMQFKINNNFPRYPLDNIYASGEIVSYTKFNCEGGKVVPVDLINK